MILLKHGVGSKGYCKDDLDAEMVPAFERVTDRLDTTNRPLGLVNHFGYFCDFQQQDILGSG